MINERIQRLEYLCRTIPTLLQEISNEEFIYRSAPDRWSKKQILGHLIDSATNNHQRFVRAQFEDAPLIIYDQNKWNTFSYYDKIPLTQLIRFWEIYNLQLVELVKNIPAENLKSICRMGGDQPVSLEFVFDDYVDHLERHLKQICTY